MSLSEVVTGTVCIERKVTVAMDLSLSRPVYELIMIPMISYDMLLHKPVQNLKETLHIPALVIATGKRGHGNHLRVSNWMPRFSFSGVKEARSKSVLSQAL